MLHIAKQLKQWPVPWGRFGFCGICCAAAHIYCDICNTPAHIYCDITPRTLLDRIFKLPPSRLTQQPLMLLCHWPPALTMFIGILHRGRIVNVNFDKIHRVVATLVRPLENMEKEVQHHSDQTSSVLKWLETQTKSLGTLLAAVSLTLCLLDFGTQAVWPTRGNPWSLLIHLQKSKKSGYFQSFRKFVNI